jgi:hypothetical protein
VSARPLGKPGIAVTASGAFATRTMNCPGHPGIRIVIAVTLGRGRRNSRPTGQSNGHALVFPINNIVVIARIAGKGGRLDQAAAPAFRGNLPFPALDWENLDSGWLRQLVVGVAKRQEVQSRRYGGRDGPGVKDVFMVQGEPRNRGHFIDRAGSPGPPVPSAPAISFKQRLLRRKVPRNDTIFKTNILVVCEEGRKDRRSKLCL